MKAPATAVIAAVLVIASGCGSQTATDTTTPPAVTQPPTTAASTSTAETTSTVERSTTTSVVSGPGVAVPVASGDLPTNILKEQLDRYPTLLTAPGIVDEFHVLGLPYPDGPGVIVIAHQQIVANITPDGASRFDSVTYAFLDPRSDTEIIEAFAAATGMDVAVGSTSAVIDGTCTQAEERSEALLTYIACTLTNGAHTMQIVRDGWTPGSTLTPELAQQHIDLNQPIIDAIDGTLEQWDLRRNTVYPSGYAIGIDYTTDGPVAIETLGQLLPGWSETPDDGYGPGYRNGDEHWYITENGLSYTVPAPDEIEL